jgi:hypothetical protein
VTDPGPQRAAMFALYRQTLEVSPVEAKRLLDLFNVEVARGPRMKIQRIAEKFRIVGATVEIQICK